MGSAKTLAEEPVLQQEAEDPAHAKKEQEEPEEDEEDQESNSEYQGNRFEALATSEGESTDQQDGCECQRPCFRFLSNKGCKHDESHRGRLRRKASLN